MSRFITHLPLHQPRATEHPKPEVLSIQSRFSSDCVKSRCLKLLRAQINLRRDYSINQVECCRNFVFKRRFPIHKIFERSCDLGLFRLTADKVAQIFGLRVNQEALRQAPVGVGETRSWRPRPAGLLQDRLRAHVREVLLRIEACSNRLKDFRQKRLPIAGSAWPSPLLWARRRSHIKIHHRRMIRLLEVQLHAGTQITGWRSRDIHRAVLEAFALSEQDYTLTQARYTRGS